MKTYRIALNVEGIWFYSVPWTSSLEGAIHVIKQLHRSDKLDRIVHSVQALNEDNGLWERGL